MKLINDFEKVGIPNEDVWLVSYGKIAIEHKTILDPYSISGSDIINISKERQSHKIVELMKVNAMARIFSLATGRNNGA